MFFSFPNKSCHAKPATLKADLRLVAKIIPFQLLTSSLKNEDENLTNVLIAKLSGKKMQNFNLCLHNVINKFDTCVLNIYITVIMLFSLTLLSFLYVLYWTSSSVRHKNYS